MAGSYNLIKGLGEKNHSAKRLLSNKNIFKNEKSVLQTNNSSNQNSQKHSKNNSTLSIGYKSSRPQTPTTYFNKENTENNSQLMNLLPLNKEAFPKKNNFHHERDERRSEIISLTPKMHKNASEIKLKTV